MTTRTLGQIASETMSTLRAQASAEELCHPVAQAERWEAVAQAVAEVARNRLLQTCEDERLHDPQDCDGDRAYEAAITDCKRAIKRMRL